METTQEEIRFSHPHGKKAMHVHLQHSQTITHHTHHKPPTHLQSTQIRIVEVMIVQPLWSECLQTSVGETTSKGLTCAASEFFRRIQLPDKSIKALKV